MTASTDDVRVRPPSWVCVSPHTCIRCSDVVDQTFLANKFACSCVYVENGAPCVHQELIDGYKSRIYTSESGPKQPPHTCESLPSTSTSTGYCKPGRHKSRRKIQPVLHHQATPTHTKVDCQEMKSLLESPAASTSTILPETCQFNERLANWTESTDCIRSESSTSSSSTTSRSSSSESCNSSSTSSSSTDPTSSSSNTTSEPVDINEVNASSTHSQIASRVRCRRGYKIMNEERLQNGGTSSDEENAGNSLSAGSDSDVSSSDGSTSASSDDSWWQTYEREKDILFLKQNDLIMKDSGYVSTTSPNTDSTKTDD